MSERPELKGLIRELGDLPWSSIKRMALHLGGMNPDLLKSIEEESRAAEDRLYCVMQKWLQRDVGVSWDQLVQALRNVELNVLAERIHTTYCSSAATPETKTSASAASPSPRGVSMPSSPAPFPNSADEIAQSVSPQAQVSSPTSDTTSSHVMPTESTAVVAQLEERIKQIEDEIARLDRQFSNIRKDTHLHMRERETKEMPSFLEVFRVTMAEAPLLEEKSHPKFFEDDYFKILGAQQVSKIFVILRPYFNYMNYGLLQFMIDEFGNSSLKEEMSSYGLELETFEMETTVDDFAAATPDSFEIPERFRSVVVKIKKDASKCTLYDVRKFVMSTAKKSSLSPYVLMLQRLCVNTVVVHLGVPRQALVRVSMAFDSVFLELHCIISVLIDGLKLQDYQLLGASEEGDSAMVSALIEAGASLTIRSTDVFQQTPLHLACYGGHITVVEILLDRGSDLRALDHYQHTPLHYACVGGHVTVVEILLDRGSDLRAQNHLQQTPLHLACHGGHVTVVKILLDRGSDLKAQDYWGRTPLIIAAECGKTDVVKVLSERGADLNTQDNHGVSALMYASLSEDWRCTLESREECISTLVEKGADANLQNEEGLTVLMMATQRGETSIVQSLLRSKHVDVNIQENSVGWSALFYAAKDGHLEIARLLVSAGANTLLRDQNEVTALDIARVHAHQEICELLTQQMAKSTTPTQQPERPLQFLRGLVSRSGEKAVAAYKRLEKWLKSTEQKERLLEKQRAMAKAREEEEEEEERKKREQSQLVMTT